MEEKSSKKDDIAVMIVLFIIVGVAIGSLAHMMEEKPSQTPVEIHDPTFAEMEIFLHNDKTDENSYINGKYMCKEFSTDLINNAIKQKIRCAFVVIDKVGEIDHAIVAFNTTDQGLIYIEPMSDAILEDPGNVIFIEWWNEDEN